MAELGVGYISIIPETSKIAPGINKALNGVSKDAQSAGGSMGKTLMSGLSKTAVAGAVSAGAAITGIMGTSLVKGFGRLQAVDQAEAKFRGLGYTASEITGIMSDVSASVTGTAFSTADAANVAAMAMASGAKPGQELQRTLRLVGDSAAFAGVSFAEMGPVFTEAMSMGKVTGETLAQMRDRGVPAIQALADSLGVSTAEVQQLASAGEISFEQFATAMETYIGGQALASGDTFKGALDNMGAAMGRFGQTLLDPLFSSAPPIFSALGGVFDEVTKAVEPAVARIGQALTPALEALAGVIETRLAPAMADGAGRVAELVADLAVDALDPGNWDRYASLFSSLADTAHVAGPAVLDLVGALGRVAGAVSVQVWEALAGVLEALVPIINDVLVPVLNEVADVASQHPGLVQAMVYAWMGMKGVSAVAGPVKSVTSLVKGFGDQMKLQKSLAAAGGKSISGVGAAFATVSARLSPLVSKITGIGPKIAGVFSKLGPVFTKIGAAMKPFVGWVVRLAPQLLRFVPIIGWIVTAGTALWAFFTKTETGRRLWDQLMEALKSAWAWLKDTFGPVWEWLKTTVTSAWDGIKTALGTAVDFVKGKWDEFTGALSGFYDTWIRPIVDGFSTLKSIGESALTGIKAMFSGDEGVQAVGAGLLENVLSSFMGEGAAEFVVDSLGRLRDAFTAVKDGVVVTVDWIKTKWEEFTIGFGQFYDTWIQPVVDGFVAAWQWTSDTVSQVFAWLTEAWSGFTIGFGQFYDTWIQPVVDAFTAAWTAAQPVLEAVWSAIKDGFGLVGQGISLVWTSVVQPVWSAIQLGAQLLGQVLLAVWSGVVVPAFQLVGTVISSVWNNIISPVFNFFKSAVGLLADVLTGNFGNIKNRFSEMGSHLASIVRGPINVAMDTFKGIVRSVGQAWGAFKTLVGNVVSAVRDKVSEMVNNIKEIPGKIKDFFSDAGNWLKQAGKNIINGLIDGIKSMAGSIGSAIGSIMPDSVFGISLPLASGGITMAAGGLTVESYGHGGRWLPNQARIERPHGARGLVQWAEAETGGEAYIPLAPAKRQRSEAILAKVAGMFGGVVVDRSTGTPMGTTYRGDLGPQAPARFADGGITAKSLLDFVHGRTTAMRLSLEGAPYVWGGGSPSNWGDCSGTQSMIAGFLAGRWAGQAVRRLFATGSQASVARQLGYTVGRPPPGFVGHAMGWRNGGPAGGHTAGTIFTGDQQVNVEMGGARGNGQIGGRAAAWNDSYFNQFAYRPAAAATAQYVSQDFGDSTANMPGLPTATGAAATTQTQAPSFGAADALYKQASQYLGVIADQTVQLAQAAANTSPTAGTQQGSDWNGGGLAAEGMKPPADWGPEFFNYEIARQAKAKNLPADGAKIGVATTLVEAGDPQKMWANKAVPGSLSYRHDAVGSDHDSVGLFQQRQQGWGTLAQRMSPFESAGLFFDAMLRKFPQWQSMDPGAVAQGVQVSAFPARYATKMAKAATLVKQTGLYDTGGVINPGITLVRNESGKPEAILNHAQWNGVLALAASTAQMVEHVRRMADDVRSIAEKGLPAVADSIGLLSDIAVTGRYTSNTLFDEDSPLTEAALAMHAAGQGIADSFDEVSEAVWKAGENIGGAWLGQATIVQDAEKGLAEIRRQLAKNTTDYTEVEKQRGEAYKALDEAGGIDPVNVETLAALRAELHDATAGTDVKEIQARSEAYTDSAEAISKRLATGSEDDKKRAEALTRVAAAEDAVTKTRLNELNAILKLEAAHRTVAAARYTAIGDTIKAVSEPFIAVFDTAKKFTDQVAKAAAQVDKLRAELADMRIEQINLGIKVASATLDARVAETDLIRTRLHGAISIAKAEQELDEAKLGQLTLVDSSVAALARGIDRFRIGGLDAIADIGMEMVVNTDAVKQAEWALALARAQARLDEHKALFESTKATFALQQATALQTHTAEMQKIVTAQLAAQTQAVMGMSQQAANGFSRFASGASQGATGLAGLLGNIAGGLASFATGNIAGVVSNVVGGIGNLGGLILGGNKMAQNIDEAREAFDSMDGVTKLGLGLSLLGGGAAAGLGVAASTQYGPEALGWGAQIGGSLINTAFDTVTGILADNMEAVNGRFTDQLDALKSSYDMDKALAEAWMAAQQAMFDAKQAEINAEIDEAKIGVDQAKASQDGASDGVLAAYEAALEAARARRTQLGEAQQVHDAAVAAAVAELGKPRQPVNITVQPGMYGASEVADLLTEVLNRVDVVEARVAVSQQSTVSASEYVAARVK